MREIRKSRTEKRHKLFFDFTRRGAVLKETNNRLLSGRPPFCNNTACERKRLRPYNRASSEQQGEFRAKPSLSQRTVRPFWGLSRVYVRRRTRFVGKRWAICGRLGVAACVQPSRGGGKLTAGFLQPVQRSQQKVGINLVGAASQRAASNFLPPYSRRAEARFTGRTGIFSIRSQRSPSESAPSNPVRADPLHRFQKVRCGPV